jgi:ribonuclease HI
MFFDGSKNAEGAGAGVVLISPKGDKLHYALRINFTPSTNNVTEYEALLHDMRAAKEMSISHLRCYRDLIAGMMAPEKSWCLVECPAHWEPQEEGMMNTAARFSLS